MARGNFEGMLLVPLFMDRQPAGDGPCLRSQGFLLFLRSLINAAVCSICASLVRMQWDFARLHFVPIGQCPNIWYIMHTDPGHKLLRSLVNKSHDSSSFIFHSGFGFGFSTPFFTFSFLVLFCLMSSVS